MERKDEDLIKTLLNEDPELKEKYEEHVILERQLAEF